MAVLGALAAPIIARAAGGWTGSTAPNDPGYNIAEQDPAHHCLHDEEWYLFSFIPKCTPMASDGEGAAGMSVDLAWKQFSFGRPDVRIAYVEGGVNWQNATARAELADRSYLNTRELPLPERADGSICSSYDCNGDGVVNVEDYAADPRLQRPYVNGSLTPEDLIVAFGHCQIVHGLIQRCPPGGHFDNDGNGYANDIAGWNFFRNNNDPATNDSAYGHSDGQMEHAAAEGNNGVAGVGICPGCTLIPIKAGDEALDRTDALARSVYFAVDSGASVIALTVADLSYSNLMRAALDYAWKRGVVVTGSSNDFDSADHQDGMFWPRVWPANGVVANDQTGPGTGDLSRQVTSFRERSNYTSFGPHALFSVSTSGGSTSESTPTQAAVAALVATEGRNAAAMGQISGRLDAGEIKQVVRATAANINDPNLGWPGLPGASFNIQYGYGRPNVLRADEAVAANRIPPVPDILAPSWYALYDPMHTARVPIEADIAARRARRFSYVVEYGLGPQPLESGFHVLARGHVNGHRIAGVLATLDLRRIPASFWKRSLRFSSDLSTIEQYDVTIRVQATDERGNIGEDRRVIAVFHDPSLRMLRRLNSPADGQPVLADLLGSGKLDIVFGDAGGAVHALDPDTGRELPGWPAHTRLLDLGLEGTPAARAGAVPRAYEPIEATPAVGDMFGNGALDVVVASTTGRVYVFDRHARLLPGFPRSLGADVAGMSVPPPIVPRTRLPSMGSVATPVLAPALPGSRTRLDVVQAAWDGKVYAIDGRGGDVSGWPVMAQIPAAMKPAAPLHDVHDYKLIATPTLADLFGDGHYEIVLRSQESAQDTSSLGSLGSGSRTFELALWPDGNRHPGGPMVTGWPATMSNTFDYYGSAQDAITEGVDSASSAPIGGGVRGDLVIQTAGFLGGENRLASDGSVAASISDIAGVTFSPLAPGQVRVPTSTTDSVPVGFSSSGTIAKLGGRLEYLAAGPDQQSMLALLHGGIAQRVTNFMRANDAHTLERLPGFPAPLMGLAFLAAPAVSDVKGDGRPDVISPTDSNNIAAFDGAGQPVPGWPKFTGGWTLWTPAVGDLDADGHNEVVAVTREGYLFVWRTPGRASQNQAYSWHQDNWHTGRFGIDTRPPIVPRAFRVSAGRQACWIAPGDDWAVGRAARYEMRLFARRPTPESFASGRIVGGLPAPAVAGSRQCVQLPGGRAPYVALRAIDAAGLRSMPAVARLSG